MLEELTCEHTHTHGLSYTHVGAQVNRERQTHTDKLSYTHTHAPSDERETITYTHSTHMTHSQQNREAPPNTHTHQAAECQLRICDIPLQAAGGDSGRCAWGASYTAAILNQQQSSKRGGRRRTHGQEATTRTLRRPAQSDCVCARRQHTHGAAGGEQRQALETRTNTQRGERDTHTHHTQSRTCSRSIQQANPI